ncbi:MAG: hypothetical protein PHT94_00575 [Candidatus Nanoarchaeia archaeon]|nr:hypothetical protein [Candidatus Nanoarchaeia archaeon]
MYVKELDAILAAIDWEKEKAQGTKDKTLEMLRLTKLRSSLVKERLKSLFGDKRRIYLDLEYDIKNLEHPRNLPYKFEGNFYQISTIIRDFENDKYQKMLKNYQKFTDDQLKSAKLGIYELKNVKEYLEGFVSNEKGQKMSISKFLNNKSLNIDSEIIKVFSSRPSSQIFEKKFRICISCHPADVLAASSGQRWVSCMSLPGYNPENMQGGAYYTSLKGDIVGGSIIAYLIEDGGEDLKNPKPHARLLAKPFVLYSNKEQNEFKDIIYVNEKRVYSDGSCLEYILNVFNESFDNWLKRQEDKSLQGRYERKKMFDKFQLYPDSTKHYMSVYDIKNLKKLSLFEIENLIVNDPDVIEILKLHEDFMEKIINKTENFEILFIFIDETENKKSLNRIYELIENRKNIASLIKEYNRYVGYNNEYIECIDDIIDNDKRIENFMNSHKIPDYFDYLKIFINVFKNSKYRDIRYINNFVINNITSSLDIIKFMNFLIHNSNLIKHSLVYKIPFEITSHKFFNDLYKTVSFMDSIKFLNVLEFEDKSIRDEMFENSCNDLEELISAMRFKPEDGNYLKFNILMSKHGRNIIENSNIHFKDLVVMYEYISSLNLSNQNQSYNQLVEIVNDNEELIFKDFETSIFPNLTYTINNGLEFLNGYDSSKLQIVNFCIEHSDMIKNNLHKINKNLLAELDECEREYLDIDVDNFTNSDIKFYIKSYLYHLKQYKNIISDFYNRLERIKSKFEEKANKIEKGHGELKGKGTLMSEYGKKYGNFFKNLLYGIREIERLLDKKN